MSHANRGKSFERAIDAMNKAYEVDGIASISQNHPEWIIRRRGPKIVGAIPKKHGGVDFYGTIKGGRSIYFDAKETQLKTRFPLDDDHVRPMQLDFLRTKRALGALTFFLVHLAPLERVFIVSLDAIDRAKAEGRASLSLKELEAQIEVPSWAGLPDYLNPLMKQIGGVA